MIDSRLEDGAILWKGKSPLTEHYLVIVYDKSKNGPTDATICPEGLVNTAKILGFNIKPHWDEIRAKEGYKAISYSRINRVQKWELEQYQIDPLVLALMSGGEIKNQNVIHMLRRDDK